jgi:hypothetical protein
MGGGTCRTQQLHAVAAWCTRVIGSYTRVDPERSTMGGAIVNSGEISQSHEVSGWISLETLPRRA